MKAPSVIPTVRTQNFTLQFSATPTWDFGYLLPARPLLSLQELGISDGSLFLY